MRGLSSVRLMLLFLALLAEVSMAHAQGQLSPRAKARRAILEAQVTIRCSPRRDPQYLVRALKPLLQAQGDCGSDIGCRSLTDFALGQIYEVLGLKLEALNSFELYVSQVELPMIHSSPAVALNDDKGPDRSPCEAAQRQLRRAQLQPALLEQPSDPARARLSLDQTKIKVQALAADLAARFGHVIFEVAVGTQPSEPVRVEFRSANQWESLWLRPGRPVRRWVSPGTYEWRRATAGSELSLQAGQGMVVSVAPEEPAAPLLPTDKPPKPVDPIPLPAVVASPSSAALPPSAAHHPASRRRPLLIGLGIASGVAGGLLLALGVTGLSVDGQCVDAVCDSRYSGRTVGGLGLGLGLALLGAGTTLVVLGALPSGRRPAPLHAEAEPNRISTIDFNIRSVDY